MKRFVAGADRGQSTLLPECLDDFVDESNPVRVIDAFVDALDLAELGFDGVVPEATGRPSYHPSSLLTTASGQLATTPTTRVANADAKVLARYLAALGADIGPDRLNDLLVLLTVALVEMGGGLSLALGLALSAAPASRPEASPSTTADHSSQAVQPPVHALPSTPATALMHPTARLATILDYVVGQGGRALTSRRKLADALGRPATTVADELARLVAAGAVRTTPGPRGTLIELAATGRPN